MLRQHKLVVAALALIIGLAGTANAQQVSADWLRATSQVRPGDVVRITDIGGHAFTWTLADVPIDDLISQAGLSQTDVGTMAVERRDTPWNGALIGLAIAGTPWLVLCAAHDWCYYNEYGAENLLRVTALTTTAIGAGIGALIDLSIHRRIAVFRNGSARSVLVSPEVAPARVALRVGLAF